MSTKTITKTEIVEVLKTSNQKATLKAKYLSYPEEEIIFEYKLTGYNPTKWGINMKKLQKFMPIEM